MSYQRNDSYRRQPTPRASRGNLSGLKLRLIIAAAVVLFSVVSYYNKGQVNPITGVKQPVDMNVEEEIALGLQSVPQMGRPSMNQMGQRHVDEIGFGLVRSLNAKLAELGKSNPYQFEFHLLDDSRTVNAFALPGGQVFITEALYRGLDPQGQRAPDGPLAGVLGHEIGHVIERHGSQRMAKGNLLKGITGAVGVASGDANGGAAAAKLGQLVQMRYGRKDELQSDEWGVQLMVLSGYDPRHLISVMDVLERTSGGAGPPEFMSTHPRPANRKAYINGIIEREFPNGVPANLR